MIRITALRGSATDRSGAYLDQMFRLRARVFSVRLGWDVTIRDGRECDTFDDLQPTYILALNDTGRVVACARLLPASGPMMVTTVFSDLLGDHVLTRKHRMVESSRFCVDTAVCERGKGHSTKSPGSCLPASWSGAWSTATPRSSRQQTSSSNEFSAGQGGPFIVWETHVPSVKRLAWQVPWL